MDTNIFDELVIVKRSGQRVSFNKAKIAIAIKKAFDSTYDEYDVNSINKIYADVLSFIENNYKERKTISVEDIQDIIENKLQDSPYKEVYESFKQYRIKRAQSRDLFTTKQQHKFLKAMEFLASKEVNSFQSILTFANSISTEYSKAYLLDNKYVRSHDEGILFVHNLDYLSFRISKGAILDLSKININDNYIFYLISLLRNLKKEQYGEHVLASLDMVFIPYYIYLYKDSLVDHLNKYLEMEGLIPYININALKDEILMLDGIDLPNSLIDKYFKSTKALEIYNKSKAFSESKTNQLVYQALKNLLASIDDDESSFKSGGYTVSFSGINNEIGKIICKIIIELFKNNSYKNIHFNYKLKGLEQIEDVLDLAEVGKSFNIINLNSPNNISTYKDIEYFYGGEKIIDNINEDKRQSLGRIMLANSSINLVRIALTAKDKNDFYQILNSYLDLAKNELLVVFENMCNYYKENYNYLFKENIILDSEKLEPLQKVRKIFRGGVLYINIIGLYETKKYFFKNDEEIIELLEYLDSYAKKISNDERLNFSISAINYQDSSSHFINIDKTIFGNQIDKLTNNNLYEEAYKAFNLTDISKFEGLTHGGHKYIIDLNAKVSKKKLKEMLTEAINNNISFINIKAGD